MYIASLTGPEMASRVPVKSAEAIAALSPGSAARMRWSMPSRMPWMKAAYRTQNAGRALGSVTLISPLAKPVAPMPWKYRSRELAQCREIQHDAGLERDRQPRHEPSPDARELRAMGSAARGEMTRILLVQGANLTFLGRREPAIYGTTTPAELDAMLQRHAKERGYGLEIFYSNIEGEAINRIYRA